MKATPLLFLFSCVLLLSVWHPRASGQSGLLTCSPAPCVLPPVQASEGGNPVTSASIAVNPLNPKQFLLGAQDTNCPLTTGYPLAFYSSTDGGSTWSAPACMGPVRTYSPCCYPTAAYDRDGVAYAAGDYFSNSNLYLGLLAFQKSTDGVTWSNPAVAVSGNLYMDTPRLAVDANLTSPHVESLYLSYQAILTGLPNIPGQLRVTHSSDGGQTWTTKAVTPQQLRTDTAFSNMAIGKDGTVYLTWLYCAMSGTLCDNDGTTAYMMFSKSTDGGNSWSRPNRVTTVNLAPCSCGPYATLPNTNARVSNFPVIGVDNSAARMSAVFTW